MEPFNRPENWRIVIDASATPNPRLFLGRLQARYKDAEASKNKEHVLNQLGEFVDGLELITISIKKVTDKKYTYSFTHTSGPLTGGGQNGTVESKYGYWLTKMEGAFDS